MPGLAKVRSCSAPGARSGPLGPPVDQDPSAATALWTFLPTLIHLTRTPTGTRTTAALKALSYILTKLPPWRSPPLHASMATRANREPRPLGHKTTVGRGANVMAGPDCVGSDSNMRCGGEGRKDGKAESTHPERSEGPTSPVSNSG